VIPTAEELAAALEEIRAAPADRGEVRLVVRRPAPGERETLAEATLDPVEGIVGDDWSRRRSGSTADGGPDPRAQVTLMGARVAAAVAGDPARWALAGDQLYVDLDLSETNLPAGTRLRVGSAVLEVSAKPHTGCAAFASRFGTDALRFVGTPEGRALRLRGMNARVIERGVVRPGDVVERIAQDGSGPRASR
jgi:MOSC domain-containing protein YiiM